MEPPTKPMLKEAADYYEGALAILGKQSKLDADQFDRVSRNYADLLRAQGKEALLSTIEKARPAIEHFLDETAGAAEASVPGRLQAIQEAKRLLLAIPEPTARELYVRYFAERLHMEPRLVAQALRGAIPPPARQPPNHGSTWCSRAPPVEHRES